MPSSLAAFLPCYALAPPHLPASSSKSPHGQPVIKKIHRPGWPNPFLPDEASDDRFTIGVETRRDRYVIVVHLRGFSLENM